MVYEQENLRYSFYEISEILKHLPMEWNEKLPEKFKKMIYENKTNNEFIYDDNENLENQKVLRSTKVLLSILYRTYWCSSEKRKELEEADENILREKYNPDNIFKRANQKLEKQSSSNANEVAIVKYKESIWKKIINSIKRKFQSPKL